MVTISGKQPKARAKRGIEKYGKHFQDCVRQTKSYCRKRKNRKPGETISKCAQGICFYHLRYGKCAIGGVHKFGAGERRFRANAWRVKEKEKKKKKRSKR